MAFSVGRTVSFATPLLLVALALALAVPAQTASAQVSGVVLDALTLGPIEGAIVTLQATEIRTETDADGEFTLTDATGIGLVIVAAKKSYYHAATIAIAPAIDVEILMEAVPQDDDPDYTFVAPVLCGFCHEEQYEQWSVSRMGTTGLNTWVYDVYNGTGTAGGMGGFVYTVDSVHALEDPISECAACHQPERWISEGPVALGDFELPTADMLDSVSCDVCHKIANVDVDVIANPGPGAPLTTITRPNGPIELQVQYGVLGDASYIDPFNMRPSYQPQLVAEVCGVCHEEHSDPDEDGDYYDAEAVAVQTTYSSWAASPYGDPESASYQTCADCHMAPPSDEARELCNAQAIPLIRPGSQIHDHDIRGSTPEFLDNAVTLELSAAVAGNFLEVAVDITNDQAGHSVPTGIPLRHLVLVVEATTGADPIALTQVLGPEVDENVAVAGDPDLGYYGGMPGKVYGHILEDAGGNYPVFYTEGAALAFDTAIAPLATDSTLYTFALPAGGGAVDVRARLIYRRAYRQWIDDKEWTVDGLGFPLEDLVAPHYGHLMEEATTVVDAPAPTPEDFVRGDLNNDGAIGLVDTIVLLSYLFSGGAFACHDAGDINDSGDLGLVDAIVLLTYQFNMGAPPEPPFPDCGLDDTADAGGGDIGCLGPVSVCP
ncbi:MAG: hypothetical protein L0Z55_03195 [Planctomycetes bacterium]|nr:hypothetical protein [Planctomycetota bacterium]